MAKVFFIIWSIISVLIICFEFYAEQEVRSSIGTDKKKISNYKKGILWNILIFIYCIATLIYFSIIDSSLYVIAIILCIGQAIRSLCIIIAYIKDMSHSKK